MASRRHIAVTTEPTAEPVTIDEVKAYGRITSNAEDALIAAYITGARKHMERYLRRALITQSITMTLDQERGGLDDVLGEGVYELPSSMLLGGLPNIIELPYAPVQSITSVTTYDLDNTATVYASSNYTLDIGGERLFLNSGSAWPSGLRAVSAVKIIYVAGYGATATNVPQPIRTGMLIHIQSMFDKRLICDMPDECRSLVDSYRIRDRLAYG